jgi:hypothetical protein
MSREKSEGGRKKLGCLLALSPLIPAAGRGRGLSELSLNQIGLPFVWRVIIIAEITSTVKRLLGAGREILKVKLEIVDLAPAKDKRTLTRHPAHLRMHHLIGRNAALNALLTAAPKFKLVAITLFQVISCAGAHYSRDHFPCQTLMSCFVISVTH